MTSTKLQKSDECSHSSSSFLQYIGAREAELTFHSKDVIVKVVIIITTVVVVVVGPPGY